jgi:hypothetical protein
MGFREKFKAQPLIGAAIAAFLLLMAAGILARSYWPEKKAKLSEAFYTDDDGKTWFEDSAYQVPPFPHNGKLAVVAQIYSYANGSRQLCAYLTQFKPEAKQKLEAALADARQKGLPPGSVALYQDRSFMQHALLVKKPGAANQWMSYDDPKAIDVMTVRSPDGSAVDQVFVY